MWSRKHLWSCFPWALSLALAAAVVWLGIHLREAHGELTRMKQQELDYLRMRGRTAEEQRQFWVHAMREAQKRGQEARQPEQVPPENKGHSELVRGIVLEQPSPRQPAPKQKGQR